MKNTAYILTALLIGMSALNAQVPTLLEYDGFLSGNITGNRTMGVRLYNASTNGTLLYKETIGTLNVTQGQFYFQYGQNGTLGNGTTPINISAVLTGSQNWLAITINGTEQSPRARLVAVPFALRSADAQTLSTQVGNLTSNLTTVQGQTATLNTNLGALQAYTANISTAIGSLGSNVTVLRNQTTALTSNLTTVQGQTAALSTNLGALQTQGAVVDKELTSINTQLTPVTVSTVAGIANAGFADGNATSARFQKPTAVAVDVSGNLFLADHFNHRIRKITPQGAVTTLAGNATAGFADGNGTSARFNFPCGIAVDGTGNVYVGDLLNNRVRKITSGGVVTTLAGNGTAGFANGNGTAARFNNPSGLAVDGSGNIYVADRNNFSIRKITPQGAVTTLAGNGTAGFTDGNGTTARFGNVDAVAVDSTGNVYVADTGNKRIRKITFNGVVSTLAGNGTSGFADGNGQNAMLTPVGVAVDSNGVVYVGDYDNNRVRRITPSGFVTTLAGNGNAGFTDGSGKSSFFNRVYGLAVDPNGILYVADQNNSRIRKITTSINSQNLVNQVQALSDNLNTFQGQTAALSSNLTTLQTQSANMSSAIGSLGTNVATLQSQNTALFGNLTAVQNQLSMMKEVITVFLFPQVTTLAGSDYLGTSIDGQGARARFSMLGGMIMDASGNIYVVDGRLIRKITPSGNVTTLAGSDNYGSIDGQGTEASFSMLGGMTMDASGNIYVGDGRLIRKITPSGNVTTLAGSDNYGSIDGQGTEASFSMLGGITMDASGNIYVVDDNGKLIRKITPSGNVTTLAGSGIYSSIDGQGTEASFSMLGGMTMDASGNIYVGDGRLIRKITPSGNVTTLAGSDIYGSIDGQGTEASFSSMIGRMIMDASGNIYVVDGGRIRKITPSGNVTTLAGSDNYGSIDGQGTEASFSMLGGITMDASGNIYVGDGGRIRKITPSGNVTTLAGSDSQGVSIDGQGAVARFYMLGYGMTVDASGNIYVVDGGRIRKITISP